MFGNNKNKHKYLFYIFIIIGLLFRLLVINHPGHQSDINCWKDWGTIASKNGIIWLVKNSYYNYPPGFAYILLLIDKLDHILSSIATGLLHWQNSTLIYLFLIKGLTVFADLGIVFLILKFAEKYKSNLGPILALVYFLHPAVLFDGSVWGQIDQFGLFLYLTCVYILMSERIALSSIVLSIAFMIKMQNIIFVPIFLVFIYKKFGFNKTITSIFYILITSIIICLPFILKNQFGIVILKMMANTDWFPLLSLNAFNIWWILSGLNGTMVIDKIQFLFNINAKLYGVVLFGIACLYSLLFILISGRKQLEKNYIIASVFIVLAFFHLPTQIHERYLFPVIGLLLILILIIEKKQLKKTIGLYIIISIAFFANLYIALFFNYPLSVYWPFSQSLTSALTLIISIIQIITFVWFFVMFIVSKYIKEFHPCSNTQGVASPSRRG